MSTNVPMFVNPSRHEGVYRRCRLDKGCTPPLRDEYGKVVRAGACKGNHRWEWQLERRDHQGKRVRHKGAGYATAAEAKAARDELVVRANRGQITDTQGRRMTLADWLGSWVPLAPDTRPPVWDPTVNNGKNRAPGGLRRRKPRGPGSWTPGSWMAVKVERDKIARSTEVRYRDIIELHVKPELGAFKLGDLNPRVIGEAYLRIGRKVVRGRQLSPVTIKRVHAVVGGALQEAYDLGWLAYNPGRSVKLPKIPKAQRFKGKTWTPDQLLMFLSWMEQHEPGKLVPYVVTSYGGLRRGELCGLRWSAVSDDGQVTIGPTTLMIEGHPEDKDDPKDGEERTVLLPPAIAALVNRYRGKPHERVFPGRPDLLSDWWRRYVRRAGVPYIRYHDLRHSLSSLAQKGGAAPASVQAVLGHSDLAMTARYTHPLDAQQEVAQVMAEIVGWIPSPVGSDTSVPLT